MKDSTISVYTSRELRLILECGDFGSAGMFLFNKKCGEATTQQRKGMNMNEHAGLPPQPTSSLQQFDVLVGEWNMVGTHPAFPSAAHGHSSFEWLMEGALLLWHFDWERPGPPSALSVIGHDDSVETCSMLYSDERGVARIYQMSLEGGVWKMWRDAPGFSQRMTGTFSEDGNTITCHGELSRDGSHWEQDLDVTYTRKHGTSTTHERRTL